MSFASSMAMILAWNLSSKDLRIFLTIFLFCYRFSKIKRKIHNILEFSIELIKSLILLHPYFFKTTSESLKLHSLYCFGTFIGDLKNGLCFLGNFRWWYFFEFIIGHPQNKAFKALLLKFSTLIVSSSQSTGASFGLIQPTSIACHTCSPRAYKKTFIQTFKYV